MTSRVRNFTILGLVLALLMAAGLLISSKSTQARARPKGGIELVYQGIPTPRSPR